MHLRTIRIRAFKSFPDALEIAVEPGVAVVVGPDLTGLDIELTRIDTVRSHCARTVLSALRSQCAKTC